MKNLILSKFIKCKLSLGEDNRLFHKRKGMSATEIVIGLAVALGLAILVFTFLSGAFKNDILPNIQKTINSFFN